MDIKSIRIATMEAIGVFSLCFFGGLSIISYTEDATTLKGYSAQLPIAIIHGVILYIAITIAAPISGGHINPAVSLALFLTYRLEKKDLILYWAAQGAGSLFAGICLIMLRTQINGGDLSNYENWKGLGLGEPNVNYFVQEDGSLRSAFVPFFYEMVGTFMLVLVVFSMGVDQKLPGEQVGKGVACVVIIMALSIGKEISLTFCF